EMKFMVLTVHDTEEYLREIFDAGANGYCLKKGDFSELLTAIEAVLRGKPYVSPHISQTLIENLKPASSSRTLLTRREKEILKLIGEGSKNKEIAEVLFISVKTVEKHRSNLMAKLDLHNGAALATYAAKIGLVLEPT
ncbi:MAG: response regulator transcription factor, partial [Desulfobulbus sp.]|nr:response regulator transcription factor [Desulfobulbus sp.]